MKVSACILTRDQGSPAQSPVSFHGDAGPSSFSPCSKTAETMEEEGEEVGECGGENGDWEESADPGLETKQSSQPGKQESLTQEHCSLVGQQTQVWWAQRHSLPLPVSDPFQIKGRHTQLRGPKSQVKKTQAVSQVPLSLPPLRSLSIYSPGCPGCLEHSSRESCTLVQLLFHLLTNLPPFPLFSLKPSVSCHRR